MQVQSNQRGWELIRSGEKPRPVCVSCRSIGKPGTLGPLCETCKSNLQRGKGLYIEPKAMPGQRRAI
jgi:hypothetical protein